MDLARQKDQSHGKNGVLVIMFAAKEQELKLELAPKPTLPVVLENHSP